jgi:hypothetical protein
LTTLVLLGASYHRHPGNAQVPGEEAMAATAHSEAHGRGIVLVRARLYLVRGLDISVGTAKTHVARLLPKLGARDRVQLVITAYQADLLDT